MESSKEGSPLREQDDDNLEATKDGKHSKFNNTRTHSVDQMPHKFVYNGSGKLVPKPERPKLKDSHANSINLNALNNVAKKKMSSSSLNVCTVRSDSNMF